MSDSGITNVRLSSYEPDSQEFETCQRVLQHICNDPSLIPGQRELMRLVARLHKTDRKIRRRASGSARKKNDRATMQNLGKSLNSRRQDRTARLAENGSGTNPQPTTQLQFASHSCYGCQKRFRQIHPQYHWFCPDCAAQNVSKREQPVQLDGRTVLVTGGRIKIGFQTVLKCLRGNGAVHMTTRFPNDALRRFASQPDFANWKERLRIHEVDFRDPRRVLALCDQLDNDLESLEVLIHNAAQSVRRSDGWHQKLNQYEQTCRDGNVGNRLGTSADAEPGISTEASPSLGQLVSQLSLDDDDDRGDRREQNSWTMCLDEVPPLEMLEVLLVNANAPAMMTGRLKPLMLRSRFADRYIVNVTGVDGLQSMSKSGRHPHVNMSKAALNMITRTSAGEFARDGIYMNSVDTGWVTHEGTNANRDRGEEMGFAPPLDEIDAASRILDPVVQGMDGLPQFGMLFRNFEQRPW